MLVRLRVQGPRFLRLTLAAHTTWRFRGCLLTDENCTTKPTFEPLKCPNMASLGYEYSYGWLISALNLQVGTLNQHTLDKVGLHCFWRSSC